jgi:hypothetical protein
MDQNISVLERAFQLANPPESNRGELPVKKAKLTMAAWTYAAAIVLVLRITVWGSG